MVLLSLAACASKEKKEADYASLRWTQRVSKQMKDPESIKSPFQKEVFNASQSVKTSEFKASEFGEKKKGFFGRKQKFKADTFAQADKATSMGDKQYGGADAESKYGSSTFRTSQSPFDGKVNSNADKTLSDGANVFPTHGNPAVLNRTENIKRPLIENSPSYSEDDVKRLLNKG